MNASIIYIEVIGANEEEAIEIHAVNTSLAEIHCGKAIGARS